MQNKPASRQIKFPNAEAWRKAWKQCASSWLWVFVVVGVAGACYPLIKAGLPSAPPLRFAGLRTLIGGVVLLAILPLVKKPLWPQPSNARWIVPLALVGTTLTFGSMFLAPLHVAVGIGAVLGNMQPLFVIALAAVFLKERITAAKVAALTFGLAGVTLLAERGPGLKGMQWGEGALLALVSSASAGAVTVMMRFVRPGPDLLSLSGWQLVVGSLPLLALSAWFERSQHIHWSASFLGLLLFLALVGTALSTLIWFGLLQTWEAGRLAPFLFAAPVLGLILGWVIYGETLNAREFGGVIAIFAAVGTAFRVKEINITK